MDKDLDLSSVIEKLMSNENALEMVKQLKSAVGEAEASENTAPAAQQTESAEKAALSDGALSPDMAQIMAQLAPLIKANGGKKNASSGDAEKRNKLLSALRPYLSGSRQEAVDRIMSLSKITDLLDFLPRGKE